jgi:hypothetical protein
MPKQMLKRKDGSYSQRGLWDNIRDNKGSGKKPTAQMIKQEKKINAVSKKKMQDGGTPRPVQGAPKPAPLKPAQTMKNVRWEGGNTGLSVPSYMVNETGNPLPQYKAAVKDRLKKAGKLSFGGIIKKK